MKTYKAKLAGTSSAINNATMSDLITWCNLVAPSAVDEIDWTKVAELTGQKALSKKYGEYTLKIALEASEHEEETPQETQTEETPEVTPPPTK
ncbi:MAG: hypothetical protein ACRDBG_09765 [Waterburya sp.]